MFIVCFQWFTFVPMYQMNKMYLILDIGKYDFILLFLGRFQKIEGFRVKYG